MACLHGVLMHNDEQLGEDHSAEDQYLRFKPSLETSASQDAEEIPPEKFSRVGPEDLNEVVHKGMHGGKDFVHKHSDNADNHEIVEKEGPMDGAQLMHGLLMHGDPNHVHVHDDEYGKDDDETNTFMGPTDAAGLMHGVLMHGDAKQRNDHVHHDNIEIEKMKVIGPDGSILHGILMHNDDSIGHDHSDEDSNTKHEVFSDISKIRDFIDDEDLLRIIDLEKILEKDMEEYAEWLLNEGSTSVVVSDSILGDIELMKNRYLNSDEVITNERADDTADDSFLPNESAKDLPFTADDANIVMKGHVHEDEGEDVTHDLELLGSTEPLNARHKVKISREKSKK